MSLTMTLRRTRTFSLGRLCLNLAYLAGRAAVVFARFWSPSGWPFIPPPIRAVLSLFSPLTLQNFIDAWQAAPFGRYFLNTTLLVLMIVICQLILATMAAYALVRFRLKGAGPAVCSDSAAADDQPRCVDPE